MDDRHDQYRRYSLEAEQQAKRALRDEDRASWLRIAQDWLRLIPSRKPTPEESFDAVSASHGTGQQKSDSSH